MVSTESTATRAITPADSAAVTTSVRRSTSSTEFASKRSSPTPAVIIPMTSRGVAQVNERCPCATCCAASVVHLCAFTCGRNDEPGSRAAIDCRFRESAEASTTAAGVGIASMCIKRACHESMPSDDVGRWSQMYRVLYD